MAPESRELPVSGAELPEVRGVTHLSERAPALGIG
jgi:hypothetical protein